MAIVEHTEVCTIKNMNRDREKRILLADGVAAGFNPDGSLVLDLYTDGPGVRVKITAEDVASQRHIFHEWSKRHG